MRCFKIFFQFSKKVQNFFSIFLKMYSKKKIIYQFFVRYIKIYIQFFVYSLHYSKKSCKSIKLLICSICINMKKLYIALFWLLFIPSILPIINYSIIIKTHKIPYMFNNDTCFDCHDECTNIIFLIKIIFHFGENWL